MSHNMLTHMNICSLFFPSINDILGVRTLGSFPMIFVSFKFSPLPVFQNLLARELSACSVSRGQTRLYLPSLCYICSISLCHGSGHIWPLRVFPDGRPEMCCVWMPHTDPWVSLSLQEKWLQPGWFPFHLSCNFQTAHCISAQLRWENSQMLSQLLMDVQIPGLSQSFSQNASKVMMLTSKHQMPPQSDDSQIWHVHHKRI